ncbi:hypothetical protein OAJ14_00325 [Polaribacter sp.]|nr:hypothetical protein [Polaribacter sp.]
MKINFLFLLFLFLVLFGTHQIKAQNNDSQAVIYNIGLGGFFGGLGAVINKKPNEKLGKVFIKRLWQGSLGGLVIYKSKKLVYNFSNSGDFKDAWGSKILNSIGNSIVHNAASNTNFWEKMYLNFGFNRLEFSLKNKFKVQYQIMPLSLLATVVSSTQGSFDFKNSIKTGHFIFKTSYIDFNGSEQSGSGSASLNNINLLNNLSQKIERKVIAHKIIHVYQYNDFSNINPVFNKPKKLFLNNDNKVVQFYRKWFYSDFNGLLKVALNELENQNRQDYYDNYFEKEADYYSFKYR